MALDVKVGVSRAEALSKRAIATFSGVGGIELLALRESAGCH